MSEEISDGRSRKRGAGIVHPQPRTAPAWRYLLSVLANHSRARPFSRSHLCWHVGVDRAMSKLDTNLIFCSRPQSALSPIREERVPLRTSPNEQRSNVAHERGSIHPPLTVRMFVGALHDLLFDQIWTPVSRCALHRAWVSSASCSTFSFLLAFGKTVLRPTCLFS